MRDTS